MEACQSNGIILKTRSNKGTTIDVLGDEQFFQELAVLEFDSDRKRMSVIVKDKKNRIFCYTKGAESEMFKRMVKDDNLKAHLSQKLEEYAQNGLRTLVFGYKEVSETEFNAWIKEWKAAQMASENKQAKMYAVMEKMEVNINLLGVSAIEDCLQEEVPETIDYLLKCGIKLWILTGDKRETAVNIGHTSKLITSETKVVHITERDPKGCKKQLEECVALAQTNPNVAVVLDTYTLATAFNKCEEELVLAAKYCKSAICCRVTPKQKVIFNTYIVILF